ncbi:hypothetical protein FCV25MIE_15593 [Fagus crenata]
MISGSRGFVCDRTSSVQQSKECGSPHYIELLQVPFSPAQSYVPTQQYRANIKLANTLGLRYSAVNPKICKSLIDSSIGHPHDIVRLQKAVEARDEAFIDTRAKIEALRLQVSILQANSEVMQTEMDCVQQICESGSEMPSAKHL